jgi:hypothetical protein
VDVWRRIVHRFITPVPGRAAGAGDPHDEVTEGVIELRDMRQHAHLLIMRSSRERVHAVGDSVRGCMTPTCQAVHMVTTFSGVLGDPNAVEK